MATYTWALLFVRDTDAGRLDYRTNTTKANAYEAQGLSNYSYRPSESFSAEGECPAFNGLTYYTTHGFTRSTASERWFNFRLPLSYFYDKTKYTKTGDTWVIPYYTKGRIYSSVHDTVQPSVAENLNDILREGSELTGLRQYGTLPAHVITIDGVEYLEFVNNINTTINAASNPLTQTYAFDMRSVALRWANNITEGTTPEPEPSTYPVKSDELSNCTSNAPESGELKKAYTVIFSANDGFQFNTAPKVLYSGPLGITSVTATISDDKLTATATVTPNSVYIIQSGGTEYLFRLQGSADAQTQVSVDFGIVNLYKCTAETLRQIAAGRYYVVSSDYYYSSIDLGDYITSLRRVFINVPSTRTTTIKLYDKDLSISAGVIENSTVHTKSNKVKIAEITENNIDYENTDIEIYLPFRGFETLDAERVMNKEIIVDYATDLFTGDTTITIFANDIIEYTFDCNVSQEIPYILTSLSDSVVKQGDIDNSIALTNYHMFIIVRTPKEAATDTIQPKGKTGIISTFSGYNTFHNVKLETTATRAEYEAILTNLNGGVII